MDSEVGLSVDNESPWLDMSATELLALIVRREISPVDLVDVHIRHIEKVNPIINAVVVSRFELARQEAKAAERKLQQTSDPAQLGALFGLPCTIKEFWAVRGMPQTGGLVQRREHIADHDAEIVRRAREAGAIVLGVTNVPEGGMWMETDNRLYGRTVNPWNVERTAGGSSGGEGAIIAAGGAVFGIASDIGGSIRLPAAFCGAFGHKPTGGLVPNTDHFPEAPPELSNYMTGGPIARSVEDLQRVMQVLFDTNSAQAKELRNPTPIDLRNVTVYPVDSDGRHRVSEELQQVVHRCAALLQAQGAQVRELHEPRLRHSFEIWSATMAEAQQTYADVLGDGESIAVWREALKLVLGRSDHTVPAIGMAALEQIFRRLPAMIAPVTALAAEGRALRIDLEEKLGQNAVLLYPPFSRTAPPHNRSLLNPTDVAYTAIFNILEFPSTVIPAGLDDDGLPLAVQVIAARGCDPLTLQIAKVLEKTLGPWRRAKPQPMQKRDSMIERLLSARKQMS